MSSSQCGGTNPRICSYQSLSLALHVRGDEEVAIGARKVRSRDQRENVVTEHTFEGSIADIYKAPCARPL